jgi:hypothetical protein
MSTLDMARYEEDEADPGSRGGLIALRSFIA